MNALLLIGAAQVAGIALATRALRGSMPPRPGTARRRMCATGAALLTVIIAALGGVLVAGPANAEPSSPPPEHEGAPRAKAETENTPDGYAEPPPAGRERHIDPVPIPPDSAPDPPERRGGPVRPPQHPPQEHRARDSEWPPGQRDSCLVSTGCDSTAPPEDMYEAPDREQTVPMPESFPVEPGQILEV